mgnify:CR=1 FL=1
MKNLTMKAVDTVLYASCGALFLWAAWDQEIVLSLIVVFLHQQNTLLLPDAQQSVEHGDGQPHASGHQVKGRGGLLQENRRDGLQPDSPILSSGIILSLIVVFLHQQNVFPEKQMKEEAL